MRLANIFPIANQQFYKDENMVMILAHMMDKYNPEYFNQPNQYVILDNGLYENAQVSTDLGYLIDIANNSKIKINEIVIPDAFFDKEKTTRLFEVNYPYIINNPQYNFMFVAQSKDLKEFDSVIDYINLYVGSNITVGVPKRAPFDRESKEACAIYKKCRFPIHFLGLTDTTPLIELAKVRDLIRSCDTSQIVTMIKNNEPKENIHHYFRKENDKVIDLLNDSFDDETISDYLKYEKKNYIPYIATFNDYAG